MDINFNQITKYSIVFLGGFINSVGLDTGLSIKADYLYEIAVGRNANILCDARENLTWLASWSI